MDNDVIDIKNLTKKYNNKEVLSSLTLSVPKGSVCGLLGRNGEGKTTLIKSILGLLKPSVGSISVLGDDPWQFKESTKEKLGYVPQSDRLYPWLTVREIINYTASFYSQWNQGLINRLVEEWRIKLDDKVGLLSEGQAQKVSIILALGHEPDLLIFDEPVASLDPSSRRQFLKTILEIVSGRGCTVFFSTHITSDLERVADRVAILCDGAITFNGEIDVLKENVKRLRISSSVNLPLDLKLEGAVHSEVSGQQAIVSVRNFSPQLKQEIEQRLGAQVQVEDLNLEEIFLELSR